VPASRPQPSHCGGGNGALCRHPPGTPDPNNHWGSSGGVFHLGHRKRPGKQARSCDVPWRGFAIGTLCGVRLPRALSSIEFNLDFSSGGTRRKRWTNDLCLGACLLHICAKVKLKQASLFLECHARVAHIVWSFNSFAQ